MEIDVNILFEDTWRSLGKTTIWLPTFQLMGVDQQGIRILRYIMGEKVIIGMQEFLLNFVVILLWKKAYDALLG